MPANSHERSAKTETSLGRTLVRIGRKTPGEVTSGAARLQGHRPWAWLRTVSSHSRILPRGILCEGLRRGKCMHILGLLGSHPWCYNMGPGPSRTPGSNDCSLPQPSASGVLFLVALYREP